MLGFLNFVLDKSDNLLSGSLRNVSEISEILKKQQEFKEFFKMSRSNFAKALR
jgi:hypothetical protein